MSGMGTTTQSGTTQQNQNQTQNLAPYGPAAGTLAGILGNLGNVNPNVSAGQQQAIGNLSSLGAQGSPFTGQINNVVGGLLGGGNATQYAQPVEQAYEAYAKGLQPFTQASYLDPMKAPGIGQALQTTSSDIMNQIGDRFAAAGRSGSPGEAQATSRGLAQGLAPILTNEYNTLTQNQLGALGSIYGGANSTLGTLSGMQQQAVNNQQAGIGQAANAFGMSAAGPELQLQALSQQTGIPLQNLAQMMGIALPAGQAFGTTTGTGTATGQTNQQLNASPLQQFGLLTGGLNNLNKLFPGG